jgi:hypothetical protein
MFPIEQRRLNAPLFSHLLVTGRLIVWCLADKSNKICDLGDFDLDAIHRLVIKK